MDARRLAIKYLPIAALKPYAQNARTHSEHQVTQIAASLREFGWTNPVIIDAGGGIVAGHGRVLAAALLGMAEVPVVRVAGLTPDQVRAYVIADNQLALNAGWNREILQNELALLQQAGFELNVLGFDAVSLADLMESPEDPDDDGDDVVPEVAVRAVSALGDLWQLGDHRLICGDCRDASTVDRLMDGARINLAVTSPPYAEQRDYDASSGFRPIPPDEYVEWYAPVAANIATHLAPDGSYFCNIKPAASGLDTSLYVFDLVTAHARRWGWHFATEFCWERNGIPKGVTQRFKNQFEPVYQFALGKWKMRPEAVRHHSEAVPKARGKGTGATTWAKHQGNESFTMSGRQGESGFEWFGDHIQAGLAFPGNRLPTFTSSHEALGHAAAFPVGLPEFFVKAYTDKGDTVFDPFMGSGSTLIAAHRTARRGYGVELSPLYCDVIVRRWQTLTGAQAVHAEGESFNDRAAAALVT